MHVPNPVVSIMKFNERACTSCQNPQIKSDTRVWRWKTIVMLSHPFTSPKTYQRWKNLGNNGKIKKMMFGLSIKYEKAKSNINVFCNLFHYINSLYSRHFKKWDSEPPTTYSELMKAYPKLGQSYFWKQQHDLRFTTTSIDPSLQATASLPRRIAKPELNFPSEMIEHVLEKFVGVSGWHVEVVREELSLRLELPCIAGLGKLFYA